MTKSIIEFLCCPKCKADLKTDKNLDPDGTLKENLFCPSCNRQYKNNEGFYDFLDEKGLVYTSKREKIIRSIYAKTYTPVTNFMFLFCGGVKSSRNEVLNNLNLKNGSVILETGMGAGENYLWMNNHAKNLRFFGIDIQKQMMVKSIRNLNRWKINADLFRADAQDLPFRDEMFDVVFHLGAINLFDDKRKAINEMIRVAKPGTKIIIADETEKAGKLFKIFTGSDVKNDPPIDLIPDGMVNINLKIIWKGFGYLIEFMKP